MASYSSSSVLVAEAAVLTAPLGTALPDETSVAWNTFGSWTGWTMLGYTNQPTAINYSYDLFQVDVQQSLSPIKSRKTNERVTFKTSLAQFEGALLAIALQGSNSDTAAGASQKAFSEVVMGGDPAMTERMFALEGWREDSAGTKQPVRVFAYRTIVSADGDIVWDKAAVTGIPITATGMADTTKSIGQQLLKIHVITAPASS
jgi:hypothetical protein